MAGFSGALGSLWVEVGAKISKFETAMSDVSKEIDKTIGDAEKKFAGFDRIGDRLSSVGLGLSAAVTVPIVAIGTAAIKASGDFDSAMRLVSARGDIAGNDLARLSKQAEDLGAKTQFSSKQAAEGMAEFAGAGFKVDQIYAALPGTLNLAAAAQTSVGQAATVVKDLLGQFGLAAEDTGRLVDLLAKAGNEGSGTLLDMANSLRYVGPVARAAGLDIEQTNAALLVLDKAGIRGEQAGTALRAMLASLTGPSDSAAKSIKALEISITDSSGKILPFSSLMEQARQGLAKFPNEADRAAHLVNLFGREALAAANVLTSAGSPALLDFEGKLRNVSGEAQRTAAVMNSGMGGALERMRGSVETAAQKIGDVLAPTVIQLAGHVESAANKLADFARWFTDLPGPVQTTTLAVIAFAAAVGPLLLIAGQLAGAITAISTVLPAMSAGIAGVSAAVGLSTAALAAYTVGIGAAVAAIGLVIIKYSQWQDAQADATKAADQSANALIRLERHLRDQGGAVDELKSQYKRGQISLQEYEQGLRKIAIEIGKTKKATVDSTKTLTDSEKAQKAVADAIAKATKATADAGKEAKKTEAALKPLKYQNALLDETVRQLEARYRSSLTELVKWKLAHADAASVTPKLTQVTDELNESITKMISSAKLIAPAFLDAGKQAEESMRSAVQPIRDVDAAYKTLGITSTKTLNDQAADATKAYGTIKDSGTATARDIDAAWVKMEESRIAAAKAAGQEIPRETQATLDKIKASVEGHSRDTKGVWSDWSKQVSTIITDLGRQISDVLWDGDKSWGEKGKTILKSLGESVTRAFVEPATKAIADLISGAIADLIGGKGFGGVIDRVKELGGSIAGVFGGGASAAGTATETAGNAAGSIGGAGGAAGSAASAGITGIIGAVGSVVSAISGVVGNFQMKAMNEALDNIVLHTLQTANDLANLRKDSWDRETHLFLKLDDMWNEVRNQGESLAEHLRGIGGKIEFAMQKLDAISSNTFYGLASSQENGGVLNQMLGELRTMAAKSTIVNVYINGEKQAASGTQMKLQGALI